MQDSRRLNLLVPPIPEKIDGNTGCKDSHSDERVARIFLDGVGGDEPGHGDEDERRQRMARHAKAGDGAATGIAAAKRENARGGQAEENKIHGDDVIQDLLIFSGERDNNGENGLQQNRDDWGAVPRIEPCDAAEK